ncbi:efflux RND transporter periplasmic adaptor subunit [Halodurantibacterium flavum]|uniref:Efflux RND transporter periplasmic adaptor subunit n=1 Tax=Halodurantibacterium flavum TaxID=1382802 RepID=A0ABW4S3B0_9RHOB
MTPAKPARTRRLHSQLVALTLGITACAVYASGVATGDVTPPASQLQGFTAPEKILAPEEVIRLAPMDLRETISVSGIVIPHRRVTVSAELAGIVTRMSVQAGETVEARAPLLNIAADDLRLTLAARQAERASLDAQLVAAQSALARTEVLVSRGAVPRSKAEDDRSTVDVLRAQIDAVDAQARIDAANLDRAVVRAPIAGVVTHRLVEPGQLVQPGAPLFEIIDLSQVVVEAMVPLDRLLGLAPGQQAAFWLPQDPSHRFAAVVERISPQAEAGTRSAKVYLRIANAAGALPAGLFLSGQITLSQERNALALPAAAILQGEAGPEALALRDGRLERVTIVPGRLWQAGALVEVTHGLAVGDVVLAGPLRHLMPGDPVRIAGR